MARESKSATLNKMFRVIQTVNALSPHDALLEGDPVSLEHLASLCGMTPKECTRIIAKINYGCGDAVPGAWVDFDEQTQTVTPRMLVLAFDGLLKLSRVEAFALLVALKTSGIDTDGLLAERLLGALPDLELDRFATVGGSESIPASALDVVAEAIANHAVLKISYMDASGSSSVREVEPLAIWYDNTESTWSFSAWCRLRDAMRIFRLDRLAQTPELTGETFDPVAGSVPLNADFLFEDAREALIAVRKPSTLGSSRVWHGLERRPDRELESKFLSSEEIANGAFIASIPWVKGSPWLASAVVRTFGGVEVLGPSGLREEVADCARALLSILDSE